MTETKTVEKEIAVEEVKEESQSEKFIFEDLGTAKYAQVHDYEIADSVRVIPREKGGSWDILALSTREENLDRLDKALSSDRGYNLVTRRIVVTEEKVPIIIQGYKRGLESEFPESDLLARIEVLKDSLGGDDS